MTSLKRLAGKLLRGLLPAGSRPGPAARSRSRDRLGLEALEDRMVPASFTAADLHSAGQYLLELINRGRANPTAEVSRVAAQAAQLGILTQADAAAFSLNEGLPAGTISAAAKQPLAPSPALLGAIEGHLSRWLGVYLENDNRNLHDGLGDGTADGRIVGALQPSLGAPNLTGENLAAYWGSAPDGSPMTSAPALQKVVDSMYDMLFVDRISADRGHRVNFLRDSFQLVGSGVATGVVPAGNPNAGRDLALAGMDFAGYLTGNAWLTGVVMRDVNGNNFYDIGEGVAGVTVTARSASGQVFATTSVDGGGYSLRLAPGSYHVTLTGAGLATQQRDVVLAAPAAGGQNQNRQESFLMTAAVTSLAQLDAQYGLWSSGNVYLNWGGRNEKWIQGRANEWYFILPNGEMYRWDGSSQATGTFVAQVGQTCYFDLRLLYEADSGPMATQLHRDLGLYTTGNLYLNWGGRNEKWLQGTGGTWYFILGNGDLYRWDGSSQATGQLVARLDPSYYLDVNKLLTA